MSYTPFEPEYIRAPQDSESALLTELTLGYVPQKSPEHALNRFADWEESFHTWAEDPQGRDFSSVFPDLDELFSSIQQRYPNLFVTLLNMLSMDPTERFSAEELIHALEGIPRTAADDALLAETWANIPRAPELDAIFRKWCEPHLPILRRTTSVDNLPRLHKNTSADNRLLTFPREA